MERCPSHCERQCEQHSILYSKTRKQTSAAKPEEVAFFWNSPILEKKEKMEFQNENANFCRKTDHPKELHFFGICDSKRHFFFVGFAPGSDIFCYVTSLYSHMHELEKHGCAMLIIEIAIII